MSTHIDPRIKEELTLDVRTLRCHIEHSALLTAQDMDWQELLREYCDKEAVYYVDLEYFRSEMQLDSLLNHLRTSDRYQFYIRVNKGQEFDWLTITAYVEERDSEGVKKLRLTAEFQNSFRAGGRDTSAELLREMLFSGFGRVYSNTIWIDVNADRYMVHLQII